ncbi:hypothetical protein ACFQU9_22565 [Actinomadura namibiensis]|uniref:Uncharacterized protein n=1 Tax=Actinomadura namibiensis TaxID=182080 RepID=A0A7W3LZ86_ACTNM|nr:hypothetical protein [Actinomadura namibiensis]MBA8956972.1 hypothetical protein [Actinomadura namibiensis]
MAFKLIESIRANAPYMVASVRAGVRFGRGALGARDEVSAA